MSDSRCKCPMAISMTGDGCRYCQPQEHIDRTSEWLNEGREEIDRLQAENEALKAGVSGLVEALEAIQKASTIKGIHTGAKAGLALGRIEAICYIALQAHRKGGE